MFHQGEGCLLEEGEVEFNFDIGSLLKELLLIFFVAHAFKSWGGCFILKETSPWNTKSVYFLYRSISERKVLPTSSNSMVRINLLYHLSLFRIPVLMSKLLEKFMIDFLLEGFEGGGCI